MPNERELIRPDETVAARAVEEFGFDMSRDPVCTASSDGYFLSLNAGWERLLGWTRGELMSRPFIEFGAARGARPNRSRREPTRVRDHGDGGDRAPRRRACVYRAALEPRLSLRARRLRYRLR